MFTTKEEKKGRQKLKGELQGACERRTPNGDTTRKRVKPAKQGAGEKRKKCKKNENNRKESEKKTAARYVMLSWGKLIDRAPFCHSSCIHGPCRSGPRVWDTRHY